MIASQEEEFNFRNKQLPKWIKTDLGKEHSNIENFLGVKFRRTPEIVKMDFWNTSLLLLNDFVDIGYLLLRRCKEKMGGVYDDLYNAVFYWNSRSISHELMHGLVNQLNPEIRAGSLKSGKDPEKIIALRCFSEGMAEWATVETHAYKRGITQRDFIGDLHKNRFYERAYNATGPIGNGDPHAYIEECFRKLQLDYFGNGVYSIGHYFVFHCMNYLRSAEDGNITTAEALTRLCTNPPNRTLELEYPIEYSKYLIERE